MNLYEHTIIARQDTSPSELKQLAEKYSKIVEKNEGEVIKTENWGLMNLSYLIKKNKKGSYIHFKIKGNGNVIEEDDIYNEKKHTYQPDDGNLQMNEFMTGVMNKLDGLTVNPEIVKKSRAIEVDIKRDIAIGKVDTQAVKSEVSVNNVKSKKDKLKALRHRKMYQKQIGGK